MITVNNTDHPFRQGMTIKSLMEEKNFVFPLLVVKLNGRVVEDTDFAVTAVKDGDNVTIMHLLAGG
jgi:sulfur carrier protein